MAKITNFKDEITDLVGSIPASISDDGEKIFDNGIYDVINRFAIINPSMLDLFASESTFVPDVGHSLNNIKILNVTANDASDDIVCRMVSDKLKTKVQKNSNSIYESTLNSPVCYISNGKLYTAPQYDYTVTIAAETIAVSVNDAAGAINVAASASPAVGDVFKISSTQDFTGGELAAAKGSAPAANDYFRLTNVTAGSEAIAYIGESSVSEVVKGTVTDYGSDGSSISNFPDNYYHFPILYAASRIMFIKISEYSFTSIGTFPNMPVVGGFSVTSESLPTFSAPTAITLLTIPTSADVSFTNVPTFPTFTKPTVSLTAIPTISDLSITAVQPSYLVNPAIVSAGIDTVSEPDMSTNVPSYTMPVQAFDITQLETFLETNEDIELAQGQLGRLQVELNEYQANIQNELNKFNSDNARYQANIQAKIVKAQIDAQEAQKEGELTLQALIQDYVLELQKYQAEVSAYQAEVNAQVQEYQQTVQKEIQLWQIARQTELQEYSNDIQNETASVSAQIQEYQQEITKALQTYQAETGQDMSIYVEDAKAKIGKFSQDLASATASAQVAIQNYSAENAVVSARNNVVLAKYQAESTLYSTDIQKVLQTYSVSLQKDSIVLQNMIAAHNKLKSDYEQLFVPYMPQAKEERSK